VANIRDGLIAADPQNKATYQANAAVYIKQLAALDRSLSSVCNSIPTARLSLSMTPTPT